MSIQVSSIVEIKQEIYGSKDYQKIVIESVPNRKDLAKVVTDKESYYVSVTDLIQALKNVTETNRY